MMTDLERFAWFLRACAYRDYLVYAETPLTAATRRALKRSEMFLEAANFFGGKSKFFTMDSLEDDHAEGYGIYF